MKNAKLVIITVEVNCPYCEEPQEDPFYFSHHWIFEEITANQKVTCSFCEQQFQLPKLITQHLSKA